MMRLIIFLLAVLHGSFLGNDVKMGENRTKGFLKAIQQIESSGGTNFKHPTMQAGIHKGQTAIGRYGLMPNTVNEVLVRMKRNGIITPELQQLEGLDPDTMKQTLEMNPGMEDQIAEVLANKVLDRQGDEEKAAYSWNQGHNLPPERVDQSGYQDSDYVKRFNSVRKLITNNSEEPTDE